MANQIDNTEDLIDSRDVIARLEELDAERQALEDATDEARDAYDYHNSEDTEEGPEWEALQEAIKAQVEWNESAEADEWNALKRLAAQCEHVADWMHGETLIREDYFTKYIEDLIDDCYQLPKELTSGDWPYRHITIDYEAAAEEAKVDYEEVDFDGTTFFIRSV